MSQPLPPGLRVIRAENPSPMTLDGTRTCIVGRDRPAVIDPGPADPGHIRALERELDGVAPVAILLTHGHADHAGAAPALAAGTGAPVLPSAAAGSAGRAPRDFQVETDAGTLRALATPGHTPDHLAFHWTGPALPAGGVLFVGDLLMGSGDTTLVAPPEGDLDDYLRSLDLVEAVGAALLVPTHGEPLAEPGAAIRRFREHRLQRCAQVEKALARPGLRDLDELVREVYGPALPRELRGAARGSLEAVLHHLVRSGRIDPATAAAYTPRDRPAPARGRESQEFQ